MERAQKISEKSGSDHAKTIANTIEKRSINPGIFLENNAGEKV
jgi:hypothetical protein